MCITLPKLVLALQLHPALIRLQNYVKQVLGTETQTLEAKWVTTVQKFLKYLHWIVRRQVVTSLPGCYIR